MQEVRIVHVHHYHRRRARRLIRFATSFIPFWGGIRVLLLVVSLLFCYVKFWPGDDVPYFPGAACGSVPLRPATGIKGATYAAGAAVRKLNSGPPSVAQIQGVLSDAASAAGDAVGTFSAAVKGAAAPVEPAPTAPPRRQATAQAADCGKCPTQTVPVEQRGRGGGAVVAARAALQYWSRGDAVTAVAIAGAESKFDPRAVNRRAVKGSHAKGMWQTMLPMHADLFRGRDWRDVYVNASVSHELWKASGWQPWTTYTNGAYRAFLPTARAAVAKAAGTVAPATAPVSCAPGRLPAATHTPGLQHVARVAEAQVRQLGFRGTIGGYANRNIGTTGQLSKHALGLAIDVMVETDRGMGRRIADYFAGPGYDRFHVENVIYYHRIFNKLRGWHDYAVPPGGSPHYDHVHIDFVQPAPRAVRGTPASVQAARDSGGMGGLVS